MKSKIRKIFHIPKKYVSIWLKKALAAFKKSLSNHTGGVMDLAALITNIMTLAVYCAIDPLLAEYSGQSPLLWFARAAMVPMIILLLWKLLCCIGYDRLKYFVCWFKMYWRKITPFFHTPFKKCCLALGVAALILITGLGYFHLGTVTK